LIDRAALLVEDVAGSAEALERLARAHEDGSLVRGSGAGGAAGPAGLTSATPGRAHLAEVSRAATRLVFVGLGSSRYAAEVVAASLRAEGRDARVELPSHDAPIRAGDGELLLAISSSGRTAEVVDVAVANPARVIALTNDDESPLARAAGTPLGLCAGTERSGIATRTYRATIAVLGLVTGLLSPETVRATAEAIRRVSETPDWAEPAADRLDGAESIDLVVPGVRRGAGEQAALMLREAPRLRASCVAAEEWAHTAIYTALPGHRVVVLGPSAYTDDIVRTVAGRGGSTLEVGGDGRAGSHAVPVPIRVDAPPVERALVESVAVELIAAVLWARSSGVPLASTPNAPQGPPSFDR
jgi:fructoselysine-6-P-deglycase FrlB-like protein